MNNFDLLEKKLQSNYFNTADLFFRAVELNRIKQYLLNFSVSLEPSVDIGCGNGFVFFEIFGRQSDFGIDNNEAGDAEYSSSTHRTKELIITDASADWCSSIKKIRLFFCNCVIEHIPNYKGVLEQISSRTADESYFIFTAPNDKFEQYMFPSVLLRIPVVSNLLKYLSRYRANKLNHFNQFSQKKWIELLETHSFQIIWYEEYHSNGALVYWNFLALANKLIPRLIIDNALVKKFIRSLSKYFFTNDLNSRDGGCSLIVAKKIL